MKILAQAGLVEQEKQGRSIICVSVAYDRARVLSDFLMTECCVDAPASCKDHSHD
jgi:ArsR family transcriptional regulator